MNTNMNSLNSRLSWCCPIRYMVGGCNECVFHRVGNCSHDDCSGGVFKLIGAVKERKEEA